MTINTRLLAAVRAKPGQQTMELASALGYARNRISAAVGVLVSRGLVRSEKVKVRHGVENRVWPVDPNSTFDDD
jgi:predicted transcriptional regulator